MPRLILERPIHFGRHTAGQITVNETPTPPPPPKGRVPRIAKLLALAHRFEGYLRTGQVRSQQELAELGHVTTARISQIMNLLHLAPDIQDAILDLPPTTRGRDTIILQDLQPIASTLSWTRQRVIWAACLAHSSTTAC